MSNIVILKNIIQEVFSVDESAINEHFDKDSIEGWDSVKQLSLTASVEDAFDIILDPDEILEFTSYNKIIKILKKYSIL